MKLRGLAATIVLLGGAQAARAGGLLLPGAGAISTSRAGASVAASEDGEALALNPANLAKTHGTVIQISVAAFDYFLNFHRKGDYRPLANDSAPYAGTRYPVMSNDAKPPLGIGGYQPVPVIAVVSDLGGAIPNLTVAAGLYAPNAYPFRDFNNVNGKPYYALSDKGYDFPASFDAPPPPTRYDVIHQEAAIILPSIAASYRVLPQLDVGARFSAGFAELKSAAAAWGLTNYSEWTKEDGLFTVDAKDKFVPEWAIGVTYRATPNLELAGRYTSQIDIHAVGDAYSVNGPEVVIGSDPPILVPHQGAAAICAPGGTPQALKACVDLALPMTATIGARYKFLDRDGKTRGDLELDADWENWGATRTHDYQLTVDAAVATAAAPDNGIDLKPSTVAHGFHDTFGLRLGGEYALPIADDHVLVRGGVGYDTAAAKQGWERVDIDGAARTTVSVGASYKTGKLQIDAGFGLILEGHRGDDRTCNPSGALNSMGCVGTPGYPEATMTNPTGSQDPTDQRQGPDPINPIVKPAQQAEDPVNIGSFASHYLMFMLGAKYHF